MEAIITFETRAKQAEQQVMLLTARLEALEAKLNIQKEEEQEEQEEEQEQNNTLEPTTPTSPLTPTLTLTTTTTTHSSHSGSSSSVSYDKLKSENERLKYRIKHLVRSLEEEEGKVRALETKLSASTTTVSS